jgi:RsiW-degrading membrane proteinase PrsW (M82 family)
MSVRRRSTGRLRGLRWGGAVMALLWWIVYVCVPDRVALVFAVAWTVVAVFWSVRFRAVSVAQQFEGDDRVPPR